MENAEFGQAGESIIARWVRGDGFNLMPVYEKIINTGKGPQIFLARDGSLIAPDFLAWKGQDVRWIEAKHKTGFSWHRITQRYTTGIDLRHYNDYCRVADESPWPVWLLFLHDGGQTKDSPPNGPRGLFGNTLDYLRTHENHRSDKWGSGGMVYWALQHLTPLCREAKASMEREFTPCRQQMRLL